MKVYKGTWNISDKFLSLLPGSSPLSLRPLSSLSSLPPSSLSEPGGAAGRGRAVAGADLGIVFNYNAICSILPASTPNIN